MLVELFRIGMPASLVVFALLIITPRVGAETARVTFVPWSDEPVAITSVHITDDTAWLTDLALVVENRSELDVTGLDIALHFPELGLTSSTSEQCVLIRVRVGSCAGADVPYLLRTRALGTLKLSPNEVKRVLIAMDSLAKPYPTRAYALLQSVRFADGSQWDPGC